MKLVESKGGSSWVGSTATTTERYTEHQHGDHPHDHSHHDHGDHSGYETGRERIEVLEDIFAENDHCAAHNREAFDAHNVQAINVMSSPGSGKTTVLQHVLAAAQADGNKNRRD